MTSEYGLHISSEVEGRLGRCRASVRTAIRDGLRDIATDAGKGRKAAKGQARKEPPLLAYVVEEYRVLYQVDPGTRRVVVLDLGRLKP